MAIKTGDKAPDFKLRLKDGSETTLHALLEKKAAVVYFYPKDDTPGCTVEACSFRDSYEDFKDAGAEVIGISADSEKSHVQFASKYNLPFTLISDGDGKLRDAFGVPRSMFGLLPGRVTYVIDRAGVVRHVFDSQIGVKRHTSEALETLRGLQQT
jgi:peroxiredoxin Q/BCP